MPTATIYVAGRAVAEGEYQAWSTNLTRVARAVGMSSTEALHQLASTLSNERDHQITERVRTNMETLYGPQPPAPTHRSRFAMLEDLDG